MSDIPTFLRRLRQAMVKLNLLTLLAEGNRAELDELWLECQALPARLIWISSGCPIAGRIRFDQQGFWPWSDQRN